VVTITVDVWLYGPLARYAGEADGGSHGHLQLELPAGSVLGDLLERLGLPAQERGITFIDGKLSAMPGLQADLRDPLQDGSRVALFHLKSMWPFQYRDGAALSPGLAKATAGARGVFHQWPKG
jgi:hypothetical protein